MPTGRFLSEVKAEEGLVRIALAYTGTFRKDGVECSISDLDLEQIWKNPRLGEVAIDYEHLSRETGPPEWGKAAGWVKRIDQSVPFGDGRKILWGWAEFTPACLAFLQGKEYRFFSPEIKWNARDELGLMIGTRLAGGAITNRPFLKALPPIELSKAEYSALLQTVALSESKRLLRQYDPERRGNGVTMEKTFTERFAGVGKELSEASCERLTATEKLDHGVTVLMREEGIDRADALRKLTRMYPELWEQHCEDVQG